MNFSHNPIHEAARVTNDKLSAFNRGVSDLGDYKRAKVSNTLTYVIQGHLEHLYAQPIIKDELRFCRQMWKNLFDMQQTLKLFRLETTELTDLHDMWGQAVRWAERRQELASKESSLDAIKTLFDEEV